MQPTQQLVPMCLCWDFFHIPFRRAICALANIQPGYALSEWKDLGEEQQKEILAVLKTMMTPPPPRPQPAVRRAAA